MLRDARELQDGAVVECDLCVVGGGAAGITIARALAGGPTRVCLVESGGLEYDEDVQALYRGENIGLPYYDLDVARLRYLGGTTNHWEGRCRPLDPIDFRERSWVPLSGWPISREDLGPYYRQAQEICQLGPFRYDAASWVTAATPALPALPFDPAKLENGVWQFSPPTLFGEVYRPDLERAGNMDVLLHASAVEIETTEDGAHVRALRARCLDGGPSLSIRADTYVLACGGLENPRLMLTSNRVVPAGVGNAHDTVGRYFMEHPHLFTGGLVITDPDASLGLYARDRLRLDGTELRGRVRLSDVVQEAEGVLNVEFTFIPEPRRDGGYAALRRLLRGAAKLEAPDDLAGDLALAVTDIDDTVTGLLWKMGLSEYPAGTFGVYAYSEQQPDRDSRVLLGAERDALGMRRIQLDWRLTPLDKRTLLVGARALAEEFGRIGIGRIKLDEWLTADETTWPEGLSGGFHHMGTTRMAEDPRRGVVDRDCRVHGVDNLYVAGSSVFPTAGAANPSLTIVALALRLADHLQQQVLAAH